MPAYDSIFTGAQVDEAIQKYYTIKTYNNSIWTPLAQSSTSGYFLRGDGQWSNTIEGSITAIKFIGNLEGNSDTATELATMGTSGQFYRGDGTWSNTLQGQLIIDTGLNPDGNTLGHGIKLWHDNEGGNIAIYSGNNNSIQWQIDAFDGNLRFFSNDGTGYSFPLTLTASSKLVCFGSRISTTAPTALSRVDRMIITPYYHTGGPWYICSRDDASNAYLSLYYGTSEIMTWRHNARLTSNLYMAGNLYIGTDGGGGLLNGGATDGGINSILIGDDVWLGDCNAGGIVGMKSTGSNCGFYFYNSSGTKIGHMYTAGTTTAYINNFTFYQGGTFNASDSTAINGLRIANAAITNAPLTNHGAIFSLGSVGTPCQYFYPDNQLTIYKRWYTSGAWTSWQLLSGMSSSRKIKENIQPLTLKETNKIFQLNPISFDYKEGYGDKNQVGLIAEEVYEIIPSCVLKPKDEDITETCGDVIWSIDYSRLVPYLIKLAQIQQEEIETLKEQVINLLK